MYFLSSLQFPLDSVFPERISQGNALSLRKNAIELFINAKQEQFTWPDVATIDSAARFALSEALDRSMQWVYNDLISRVVCEPDHLRNYRAVKEANRLCGTFARKSAILCDSGPFEQMLALSHVTLANGPQWEKGNRTFCFGALEDKTLPIYVMRRGAVTPPNLMQIMLGTGRGALKAPTYAELASAKNNEYTDVFVSPLNALEVMRQPYFSAATVIKAGAFQAHVIDAAHRYEVVDPKDKRKANHFACVELAGQKMPKNASTKELSAGTNLCHLMRNFAEQSICPQMLYEQFAPNGYNDDALVRVTPGMLWRAAEKSIVFKVSDELDRMMERLFVSSIVGRLQSDRITQVLAERIFSSP